MLAEKQSLPTRPRFIILFKPHWITMCYLNPLILPCFPGAERLQSEPLETLAPRRFVALWRYEELRHQLRGRRRARKHLKLQPCLASPWGILDRENGSCFLGEWVLFFFFLWLWYNEDILRYRVVFLFHVCVCFLGCRYSGDTMVNIRFCCSMMFRVFSYAVCVFLVVCCMFLSN